MIKTEDFSKTCRACLVVGCPSLRYNKNINFLFWNTFKLKVNQNHMYPKKICKTCSKSLFAASKFKTMVFRNSKFLLDIVEKQVKKSNMLRSNDDMCIKEIKRFNDLPKTTSDTTLPNISELSDIVDSNLIKINYNINNSHTCASNITKSIDNLSEHTIVETKMLAVEKINQDEEFLQNEVASKSKKSFPVLQLPLSLGGMLTVNGQKQFHYDSGNPSKISEMDNTLTNTLETEDSIVLSSGFHINVGNYCEKNDKCTLYQEFDTNKDIQCKINKIHNVSKNNNILCSVCGKTFKLKTSLYKHMRYHNSSRLHSCDHCEKKFAEVYQLKIHTRKHTDPDLRPHACEDCPNQYPTVSSLNRHKRMKHHLNPCSN